MKSILIVAGESSGEKYGASLVRSFRRHNPAFSFFGIGGREMAEEGVELIFSIEDLSAVGIFEVLSRLPRIRKIFSRIKEEAEARHPLAAVLIDSPDFNLKLAQRLKDLAVPVLYYISPTIWAWRRGRLKTIKKTVEKMLLIFPFESTAYEQAGIPATYVGHPLLEKVRVALKKGEFFLNYGLDAKKKLITLLPGSRASEVHYHLPVLVKTALLLREEFDAQFLVVKAEGLDPKLMEKNIARDFKELKVISENGYDAMAWSDLILSACGTANMEACLLEKPFIAFYRISPLTYFLGIRLVKINNFSMVNILAGKRVVPELIQRRFTPKNLFEEARRLLLSDEQRAEMIAEFRKIRRLLGDQQASEVAAAELQRLLSSLRP